VDMFSGDCLRRRLTVVGACLGLAIRFSFKK
jgi:hypothetical protein